MPPCISANSFCPSSWGIHFNFTPLSLLLYSALSTNWYKLDCGLLFPLLLALREVLLTGGNGRSAVPMLEPAARQQGLKAYLLLREHPLLQRELAVQPELDDPRQVCRSETCRERLLQRNKPWGLSEQTAPQHFWR